MKFIDLLKITQDEIKSEEYLREIGVLKTFTNCIYCNSDKIGSIRRGKHKCYKCLKEWNRDKDSILECLNIDYPTFLVALKVFSLEMPAAKAEEELEISKSQALKLYSLLRWYILDGNTVNTEDKFDIDEAKPLFLATLNENKVNITLTDNFKYVGQKDLTKKQFYIYVERHRTDDGSFYYSFNVQDQEGEQSRIGEVERFWKFAKPRLMRFQGINKNYIYEYIKEVEFRYNNRKEDIFDKLVEKLRVAKNRPDCKEF